MSSPFKRSNCCWGRNWMLAPPNPLPQTLVRMSLQSPPGTHRGHNHYAVWAVQTNSSEVTCFHSTLCWLQKRMRMIGKPPRSQGFLNRNWGIKVLFFPRAVISHCWLKAWHHGGCSANSIVCHPENVRPVWAYSPTRGKKEMDKFFPTACQSSVLKTSKSSEGDLFLRDKENASCRYW